MTTSVACLHCGKHHAFASQASIACMRAHGQVRDIGGQLKKTKPPWNWCPHCKQTVDADDVRDGTEVRCLGCDRVYVCVAYTDGTWGLV
jgi:hypothetical protein